VRRQSWVRKLVIRWMSDSGCIGARIGRLEGRWIMRFAKHLLYGCYVVVVVAAGLEVALRLYPAAIPLELLRGFDDDLRIEIAQRRGLPTQLAVRQLHRDDGGPPLYIYLPHERFVRDLKDPGKAESAVMDER